MAQHLTSIIDTYVHQCRSDQTTPDRSLLDKAHEILASRLELEGTTREVVHLGVSLSYLSGQRDWCIDMLERYLEQSLSTDEEAWARWHLTDFLAIQRRFADSVKTQKEFLEWARRNLPTDRLLWVMSDASQALSWKQLGLEDEWLRIFTGIMAAVVPSAENRLDRFYYLRTAGQMLIHFGHDNINLRADDALQIAARIRQLADEDPSWDRAFDMKVQSWLLELHVYVALRDDENVRRLGVMTRAALDDRLGQLSSMTEVGAEKERLNVLCDNAAYPLYRAHQYDLAIPLFERSIELGSPSPHARTWLAACLWATTGDHGQVLELLKQAAARWQSPRSLWDFVRDLPEFKDVSDTAEFERAATVG